ncbi:type IV pilus biogenesis protein PilM [Azonexus hydrophilus]|uniref:Type IV pilus biogenesis protein PilM n=1 Tax=Azonexus hydrophilus TaxID=418702 RepID=A0ABZ2XQ41_9RHOO
MFQIAIMILMVSLGSGYMLMQVQQESELVAKADADISASNFLQYREAVVAYVAANPSATGTIADASLTWEPGYVRDARWTNEITGGQLYTYSGGAVEQRAAQRVYERAGRPVTIGIKSGTNPLAGDGSLIAASLPGTIPDGALVYFGK